MVASRVGKVRRDSLAARGSRDGRVRRVTSGARRATKDGRARQVPPATRAAHRASRDSRA